MKIVLAPDSFKGSMTAAEAAGAMERGVKTVLPAVETVKIPMADGGEGTVDALVASTNGRYVTTTARDPLGKSIQGKYGILGDGRTAVIEMAAVSGLPLVPPALRNPLHTTTFGTGELIRDALESGCRQFIIGIGGSATNDMGTGMAQALGIRFFRADGSEITEFMRGGLLSAVAKIDLSGLHPGIRESHLTVACDVDNPLLGPRGCAHIYSPQKGATLEIVEQLENAMAQFIDIAEKATARKVRQVPGAGAAGGLGAGLMAFTGAELRPGIELVLKASHFEERIRDANLILSGEGKLDRQTSFGKTIAGIAAAAREYDIPVIAFAGKIEQDPALTAMGLNSCFTICSGPVSLEQAMAEGPALLQNSVEMVMRIYQLGAYGRRAT